MSTRIAALVSCLVAFATTAFAQESLKVTLLAQEKKLLEAIKQKDQKQLDEMFSHEAYAVTAYGGRQTDGQIRKSLNDVTITSYEISDVEVVKVNNRVGILTYQFRWTGEKNGDAISDAPVYATSIWSRSKGGWNRSFIRKHHSTNEPQSLLSGWYFLSQGSS